MLHINIICTLIKIYHAPFNTSIPIVFHFWPFFFFNAKNFQINSTLMENISVSVHITFYNHYLEAVLGIIPIHYHLVV